MSSKHSRRIVLLSLIGPAATSSFDTSTRRTTTMSVSSPSRNTIGSELEHYVTSQTSPERKTSRSGVSGSTGSAGNRGPRANEPAPAGSRRSPLNLAIQMGTLRSGDAFASPLPATLSQRQLYLTNNLLRKSDEYRVTRSRRFLRIQQGAPVRIFPPIEWLDCVDL